MSSHNKKIRKIKWFNILLDDINISATSFITENNHNTKFVLLNQKITELYIFRRIAFYINNELACKADNKISRNLLVDKWIKDTPNEPFGKVFSKNIKVRKLISVTNHSRKFIVRGEINAEIEEKFYLVNLQDNIEL